MDNMRFSEGAEDLSVLVAALGRLGLMVQAYEDGEDPLVCIQQVGALIVELPDYGQLVQHLGELVLDLAGDAGSESAVITPRVRAITCELVRLIGDATDDIKATVGGVGRVRPTR